MPTLHGIQIMALVSELLVTGSLPNVFLVSVVSTLISPVVVCDLGPRNSLCHHFNLIITAKILCSNKVSFTDSESLVLNISSGEHNEPIIKGTV